MSADITINGEIYRKVEAISGDYVIVRSRDAGVFMGIITQYDQKNAVVGLRNARRIWYWEGAATLSQLAVEGTSKPSTCRFPCAVPKITIFGICEIIPMTVKAVQSLDQVKEWKA